MKRLSALLCISTLLLLFSSLADANTRLAIGSFGLTPVNRDGELADLIAVRLNTLAGIDLVERRELNKVMDEAGLSLSGLVKAPEVIHIGALVRADQFLIATSVPVSGTNRIFVRLLDGRTGVIRSINVFTDSGSLDDLAQNISEF